MSATEPLRINGASYRRQKTGIITVVQPWEVHTEAECDTFVPKDRPYGLPLIDRQADEWTVGTWTLKLTFEGMTGSGVSDIDKAGEDVLQVELDGSMSQDTLKSNPNWETIEKKYGYSTIKEEFPKTLPKTDPKAPDVRNDLYGSDSYLAVGAIFRIVFASKNPPDSIMDKIGQIFSIPPRWELLRLAKPKGNRNWLKLTPKPVLRGNAIQTTMEFMLSGPNGWNRDVYNFSQLGRVIGADSAGSGLSSGGLTTGSL